MDRSRSSKASPKILVADDDPCVLRAIADRCSRMGFDVETATNGLQALIKAGQYEPDILVIDVHMPEVDGISVLSYLLDITKKSLHLIVVTGNPGREFWISAKDWMLPAFTRDVTSGTNLRPASAGYIPTRPPQFNDRANSPKEPR